MTYDAYNSLPSQPIVLAEMPAAELIAPSAQSDPESGRQLSKLEEISLREVQYGGQVFLNRGSRLSVESKAINADIKRDRTLSPDQKRGRYVVAVLSRRATETAA